MCTNNINGTSYWVFAAIFSLTFARINRDENIKMCSVFLYYTLDPLLFESTVMLANLALS